MAIEQPKKQAGPHMAQWFYAICSCSKLVEVTGGVIPEHHYTVPTMWGIPEGRYRCDRSLTPWTNPQ